MHISQARWDRSGFIYLDNGTDRKRYSVFDCELLGIVHGKDVNKESTERGANAVLLVGYDLYSLIRVERDTRVQEELI